MSIRHVNKDHRGDGVILDCSTTKEAETEAAVDRPLLFWTEHPTSPCLVDLTPFRDGFSDNSRPLLTAFSGRPNLISEIAPALRETNIGLAEKTLSQVLSSLRAWWRVFDKIEKAADPDSSIAKVRSVKDITEIHRQVALEGGMSRTAYGPFVHALNLARLALGLRRLHWIGPEEPNPVRHLPPFEHIKLLRNALKRNWYATLDRWTRHEQLMNGDLPNSAEEVKLLESYKHFDAAIRISGKACPTGPEIRLGRSTTYFYKRKFLIETMVRGLYPDANDIRAAFHLCLITTGWNPSTFLALDVNVEFIEPHPRDASRYLLTGTKARGNTYQITEGLFKSERSAGAILLKLIGRTKPLRQQLCALHKVLEQELEEMKFKGASLDEQDEKRSRIVDLQAGLRSPWLFVTDRGISWLSEGTYQSVGGIGYLEKIVSQINLNYSFGSEIPVISASDFRDAFAAYAYRESGGLVLYVMRVLGHKNVSTTQRYIENTLINADGQQKFQFFGNHLWDEIVQVGRVDPTILAQWCREGKVTEDGRARLEEYRTLKRSRLKIGCKNPQNPPKRLAPRSKRGKDVACSTHRCTLCPENAVILPESLPGLAMRMAELLELQANMPVVSFVESSFDEELRNTQSALSLFESDEVTRLVNEWSSSIKVGRHRVIHLETV